MWEWYAWIVLAIPMAFPMNIHSVCVYVLLGVGDIQRERKELSEEKSVDLQDWRISGRRHEVDVVNTRNESNLH